MLNNKKAASFYKRAAAIATDGTSRRFLLSSATILEASINEAEANKHLKQLDQPSVASENFEDAAKFVERVVFPVPPALVIHPDVSVSQKQFVMVPPSLSPAKPPTVPAPLALPVL